MTHDGNLTYEEILREMLACAEQIPELKAVLAAAMATNLNSEE